MFKTPSIAILTTLIGAPSYAYTPEFGENASIKVLSTLALGTDQTTNSRNSLKNLDILAHFTSTPLAGRAFVSSITAV